MQCIDLSEVVHVVKDDIIVISVHLRLLTLFVVTCFLRACLHGVGDPGLVG